MCRICISLTNEQYDILYRLLDYGVDVWAENDEETRALEIIRDSI